MPMGAWGQTLVFGEWNEFQGFVEKSAETVNWSDRVYTLPQLSIKNGDEYNETGADTYSSSNVSVATVDENGTVTFVAYEGKVTITATCTNQNAAEGGPASSLTAIFTITINDDRAEFGGMGVRFSESSATATYGLSFNPPTVDPGQLEKLVLAYSSSNTNVATVNENSGDVTIVGVGETTISAAYAGDDYVKPGSISYALTVNPATVTVSGITASNKEYDGTTTATLGYSSAAIQIATGATVSGVSVSSATGTFADANVGTDKTVTISGITLSSANYTVGSTGSQTTATASITAKEATLSWSDTEFTYDGQTHVPTATVSNLVGQDACTVTVSGAASAVGTHTATATALSNSNYSLPASATTSFTISAAAMTGVSATGYTGTYDGAAHGISVTAPEGATVTYGESANACTATASPTLTNVGEKTVYYKVSKTGYTDVTGSQVVKITAKEATLSWSNLTFTYDGQTHVPTATVSNLVGQDACTVTVSGAASAVGTHTATATALSNSNYSLPASATTSFTISAAAMTGVSATGYTGTYDGAAHGISVTAPEGATVTYGESANACTAAASPTLTNVGEKAVYYKVSKTGYTDVTGSQVVKITAKEATLSWSNLTFTYDGQTHVPTATVSNLVGQDACTVTVSGAASAVGTHTATATALSNSNYSLPASATTSFTISAAAMTGVSATGYTGTYDGAAHGISVTAPEGATVTYGESANACTASASPTLTNVGEKTVYYKVSKTGYTDVTGSQTVKITAKEATLSWSDTEFTYDGQTHVPTATVSNLVGQDACTVTVSGAASAVGTHTATATALSNSNYSLPASATTSFIINAAAMTGVSATGYTGTYDGAAHGISVTAPEGATVTYGESASACTAAASPTLTNVGEKTVYYKVSKTGYTDVTGSQVVKITAKEATLSWSDTEFTYDGQTHVPTATVSNLVGQDACTVTVSGAASAVGTHTATATALSNSNYSLPASATTSFTISAADMTGVSATGYTGTYDGSAHGISVTAPEGATVTYGESADACTAAASPTLTNVGEKTVYYKVSKTGYTDVTGSQTVKITAKEATLSWSNLTFTYDGQTHVPTATVSNLVGQDACTVTVSGAASAVGTHTATATALSNSNYSLPASATTSFTISAAAMTGVSATGYTGTYDGAAHGISVTAPEDATVTYGESADACTAAASPTLTNVGEKTVYYKVSMTGYDDVTSSAAITITAREATLSWSNTSFTYDGQTHVPTATVSNLVSGDACTVTVTGGASAVGTHTATATELSNANYSLPATATTSFTISSASMDGISATGYTGTYDGQAHGISVTAPDGATVTYGESPNDYTATASPEYSDAGTYTVYYRVSMDGYVDYTGSAVVSIEQDRGYVAFSSAGATIGSAGLTFTATIGEPFTPPTVSVTPNDATLYYESSDTNVATVDESTGEVTLQGAGTTTITATFEGDNNYTSDYHSYNLTVVELDLVIEPITKEVDYTMDGTDFLNADGTEKDLSNAVVNNILYTLKDQDSPEGDGYDPDLQSIVLNTEQSTAAVEKLIADGVEPGTKEFAQNFTGITFLVPAGEGYIIITSQELNGANLMAKVGSNAPVAISMPEMGDYSIQYLSDHETWVYLWNGGQGGIESIRTRGKKTVANIRVQNVAYKARSNAPDGILSVDVDDDDTDARWYNLRGQRIEKPKTKGLYIRNGQKVVVR